MWPDLAFIRGMGLKTSSVVENSRLIIAVTTFFFLKKKSQKNYRMKTPLTIS